MRPSTRKYRMVLYIRNSAPTCPSPQSVLNRWNSFLVWQTWSEERLTHMNSNPENREYLFRSNFATATWCPNSPNEIKTINHYRTSSGANELLTPKPMDPSEVLSQARKVLSLARWSLAWLPLFSVMPPSKKSVFLILDRQLSSRDGRLISAASADSVSSNKRLPIFTGKKENPVHHRRHGCEIIIIIVF